MSDSADGKNPTIRRLLGPAGPEISCEECFEHLDHFVEAELMGEDAELSIPGMGAHLEGCPACEEDYRSLKALVGSERPASGLWG